MTPQGVAYRAEEAQKALDYMAKQQVKDKKTATEAKARKKKEAVALEKRKEKQALRCRAARGATGLDHLQAHQRQVQVMYRGEMR